MTDTSCWPTNVPTGVAPCTVTVTVSLPIGIYQFELKVTDNKGAGGGLTDNAFIYTNGNLTGFVKNPSSPFPGDTTYITYDTRTNNFNALYPQFYFLDMQTVYDQTYRSEMFYFSKNFPTNFGTIPISVTTTANQKPFEVKFNNQLWYRYLFN